MPALAALVGAIIGACVILVAPALAAALLGGGFTWMTGDHQRGKSIVIAALLGAAVALTANQIATFVVGLNKGTPASASAQPNGAAAPIIDYVA